MDALFQDLRFALRQMRKSPLFAVAAIATLAIGTVATTAIFSTVNATLLRPLPFPHPEELVSLRTRLVDGRVTTGLLSPIELTSLDDKNLDIVRGAGFSNQHFDATLTRDDGALVQVAITGVTDGFFQVLGLPMTLGRAFDHADHVGSGPGAPFRVIASHRAWTAMFGGDPAIVGKTIHFVEIPALTTVVGVAPPALDVPHGTDFWFNLRYDPRAVNHNFDGLLRVRAGTRLEQVRSELASVMAGLSRTIPSDDGRQYVARPLVSAMVGDLGPILLIILGATALLLALACANVANLMLARGTARMREMAVRAALGASRGRIVHQLLTEALVLAVAGALAGLGLAFAAVRVLLALGASKLPRLDTVPFDARVLLFAFGVLLFAGLVMGAAPAWRLTSTDIRGLLNDGGRSATAGRATSRLMSTLIVAEIGLAIALVAGAGWLVQSFARLRRIEPGFTAAGRLVVDVRPTRPFRAGAEVRSWSAALTQHLRQTPGLALVGAESAFPFTERRDVPIDVAVQGDPADPEHPHGAYLRGVTPGLFEAMGIRLLAGRAFTDDDRLETAPVAVVNQAFVRRYLGGRDPLTAQFGYGYPTIDPKSVHAIVGVVGDVKYASLSERAEPSFYLAQDQMNFGFVRHEVVVTAKGRDPERLVPAIRSELARFDPRLVANFSAAPAIVSASLERQQLGMTLMLVFGATALALAAVGIYGVIAYSAAERETEMATRLALGASSGDVLRLMMSEGRRLALAGIALGLAAAYAGGRLVAASVYEMRASDPFVLVAATAVVGCVAILATAIPALRASRLDPVRALRSK